jgi:hypothetical protein
MVLILVCESQPETRSGPFGDSGNPDARLVHGLRRKYHRLENRFGRTRWNASVTWVLWNLGFVHLEALLVLVQDRCMICAKRSIGSEIVLDTPDGTTRLRGSTRSLFRSV